MRFRADYLQQRQVIAEMKMLIPTTTADKAG
ncbi:hypothetical protein BSFP_062730 [Burkholderia stabilis]|uniref:Uncharacterized protein n=1 Tax=Burkholderia stabilis TaxID=95485 RepID=A0A1Y1BTV7_9BURK|nr:hypothetical protein BSFP_062730 [Burkholderia stabilis]